MININEIEKILMNSELCSEFYTLINKLFIFIEKILINDTYNFNDEEINVVLEEINKFSLKNNYKNIYISGGNINDCLKKMWFSLVKIDFYANDLENDGVVHYLNKKSINKLYEIVNDENVELIDSCLESFSKYSVIVASMPLKKILLRTELEIYGGDYYRTGLEKIDSLRSSAHNVAISKMGILNKLCDIYNVDYICPCETIKENRAIIALYIFDYFKV